MLHLSFVSFASQSYFLAESNKSKDCTRGMSDFKDLGFDLFFTETWFPQESDTENPELRTTW